MRKLAYLTRLLMLMIAMLLPATAADVGVTVNGRALALDQGPVMQGGRVLVPLRGIFEALGATISYNSAMRAVDARQGATSLHLALGSRQAIVNGRPVGLDVPAQIVGGRTMVPLRFVSETLGAHVTWDAASRMVAVTTATPPSMTVAPPPPPVVVVPVPPARPAITSVSHSAVGPLQPGDVLTVTMMGTPGAMAAFDVTGAAKTVAMTEKLPGQYVGTYTVQADVTPSTEPRTVSVHLARDGQVVAMDATQPIVIGAQLKNVFVSVDSPLRGQKVARDFKVTGKTLPFATVEVRAQELHHTLIVFDARGDWVEAKGQADAAGRFAIPIHMPLEGTHRVSLEVRAIDTQGNVSKKVEYGIAVSE